MSVDKEAKNPGTASTLVEQDWKWLVRQRAATSAKASRNQRLFAIPDHDAPTYLNDTKLRTIPDWRLFLKQHNCPWTHIYLRFVHYNNNVQVSRVRLPEALSQVWMYIRSKCYSDKLLATNDNWFQMGCYLALWTTGHPHWPKDHSTAIPDSDKDPPRPTDFVWTFDARNVIA